MTIQCIASVIPVPTVTLSASPSPVSSGGTTTLTWSSTNATSCTATAPGFSTGGATNGSDASTALTATRDFAISCTGPGRTSTASTRVYVPVIRLNSATLRSCEQICADHNQICLSAGTNAAATNFNLWDRILSGGQWVCNERWGGNTCAGAMLNNNLNCGGIPGQWQRCSCG